MLLNRTVCIMKKGDFKVYIFKGEKVYNFKDDTKTKENSFKDMAV